MPNPPKTIDDIASTQAFLAVLCEIYDWENEQDAILEALWERTDIIHKPPTIDNWKKGRRVMNRTTALALIDAVEIDFGENLADKLRRVYDQTWLGKNNSLEAEEEHIDKLLDAMSFPNRTLYTPVYGDKLNHTTRTTDKEKKALIEEKKESIIEKALSDETEFDIESDFNEFLKNRPKPKFLGVKRSGTSKELLKELLMRNLKKQKGGE